MSRPLVSVIIPVYNNPASLKACLQALEKQSYANQAYEVIVVDNGSKESIEPIVAAFKHATAHIESSPGSYAARNRGIAAARGDVLAFTDSDCLPASDWLERGVEILIDTPNCGLVGGELVPEFDDPDRPTAIELYEVIMYYPQQRFIQDLNFSVTANMFSFKRIFDEIGPFDPCLKSSGDREWGQRVASAGYQLMYAENVRVIHPVRSSFEQIRQKVSRLAGGYEARNLRKYIPLWERWTESFINCLPPILSVLRLRQVYNITLGKQIKVLAIWGSMKYIEIKERLQIKWGGGEAAR